MLENPDFRGKVVAIWVKDPAKGAYLEDARVSCLGERAFLVGRVADWRRGDDPRAGATFWFPVDDVVMLTEYETMEAARKAYEAREAQGGPAQGDRAET